LSTGGYRLRKRYIADAVLISVTFVWGVMFVFIKEAVAAMSVMSHLAVRFSAAAVLLWLIHLVMKKKEPMSVLLWKRGSLMGIWLFLGFMFQTVGLSRTTASKAGFITGLCVVLVPVLGAFLYGMKLSKPVIWGIAIAFLGMSVLSLQGSEPIQAGDVLVLFGAVSFAMHILSTARFSIHHHPMALAGIQVTVAAVLNALAALFFEDWQAVFSSGIWTNPEIVRALVIGAVLATAFAFFAQTYFQRFTTATHTAIIFALEPVFTAAVAVAIGGESLTGQTWAGGTLILAGILLAELKGLAEPGT
jgi:drug/metabolite transporter (DMT)-like permease